MNLGGDDPRQDIARIGAQAHGFFRQQPQAFARVRKVLGVGGMGVIYILPSDV